MKTCKECRKKRPIENFSVVGHGRYRSNTCKKCVTVKATAYRAKNSAAYQAYARKNQLKQKFRLTVEEYEALLKEQKGRCAICRKKPYDKRNGKIIHLSVDHDHATGKVRGLLCKRCNAAIGMLLDDPKLVVRALEYLQTKNYEQ